MSRIAAVLGETRGPLRCGTRWSRPSSQLRALSGDRARTVSPPQLLERPRFMTCTLLYAPPEQVAHPPPGSSAYHG